MAAEFAIQYLLRCIIIIITLYCVGTGSHPGDQVMKELLLMLFLPQETIL